MRDTMKEFEDAYAAAIPCDDYAIVQVSPRKWLVLKDEHSRGLRDNNTRRIPKLYRVMGQARNSWEAEEMVKELVSPELNYRRPPEGGQK